jgi:DNA mismatch repair protein MSH5
MLWRQLIVLTCQRDSLLSFAQVARKYNYVQPIVTDDNILEINQGRHPLLEQCSDTLIPNDTTFDADQRIILLTGANSSGKSVYLKQVALIVYMAHLGSFVPAQSARIGLTDKILTRIATRESVSKNSSAFMIDLQQTNIALLNSTSRSLVLLDEFGKGTTSLDGIGLFCAVVESFAGREHECPKLIAATHFHGTYPCI